MKLNSLQAYELYLSVKTHFTNSDYDFFAYQGKMRKGIVTPEKFVSKNYYSVICKLAQQYGSKELLNYYVSNMLVNNGQYIFDIDSDGKRIYNGFISRKDSRKFIFKQDISRISSELEKLHKTDFWCSIETVDGHHPLLLQMYLGGLISPETMCILNRINDYIAIWDKKLLGDFIYPMVANQIKKYEPFVRIKDYTPFTSMIDSIF